MKTKEEIYLAGGCFWGTQHFIRQINGVIHTEVGYANGNGKRPTYEEVCTNRSGYAEVVKVIYNPQIIPLTALLRLFFETIDPTSLNRQGGDQGTQYRTGIYFTSTQQRHVIDAEIHRLSLNYPDKPIVVEVMRICNYFAAEDYHQDYLITHPQGYCHIQQRLFKRAAEHQTAATDRFKAIDEETLKKRLTPLQYEVTRHNATEPPYENEYDTETRRGIYTDITTGQPLFLSSDKYISGCGWPAFTKPIDPNWIQTLTDFTHGMIRTEVRSAIGDAHLGHVFTDGPQEKGGMRYCINSAALRFIPLEEMEKEGYGDFIDYLKD